VYGTESHHRWGTPKPGRIDGTVVVASLRDARSVRQNPVVYVEHGAGQHYGEAVPGFPGGPNLDQVVLFICPSERVGDLWRARYPDVRVAVVGCPALDCHLDGTYPAVERAARRNVYVTCHWDAGGEVEIPEVRPALPYYEDALPALRDALQRSGFRLCGHAHPKHSGPSRRLWARLGVPYEPDPDVVLAAAALLIADNTSLMYEAAALDVPVLALNAPWYRRDVQHGLRFWTHVPGLQCNEPEDLERLVAQALRDPIPRLRAEAASYVYAHRDGTSAQRAADAIGAL
jgi:hypothetical protein